MRTLRFVGVAVIAIAAFFGGYALCGWRFNTQVLPALETSHFLHDADFSAQVADIIDSGDIARAREKLLVRASVESKPLPSLGDVPFQWKGIFTAPFENMDLMLQMLHNSDDGARSAVSQRLTELCAKSPDTKATKYACNR
jgi:hypothetical protein